MFERVVWQGQAVADMTEVLRDKDHVVLDAAGFQPVIHGVPKAIAAQINISKPAQIREDTPIKLCLPVASIDGARRTQARPRPGR